MELEKKKWIFVLALTFCLFFAVAVKAGEVRANNVQVYLNQSGVLGFQHNTARYLSVTVVSGFINSSVNTLRIHDAGGHFQFTNLNATTFSVSYTNIDTIQVEGDSGNALRYVASGQNLNAVTGDEIIIVWSFGLAPLLPIMFIIGMVGLTSVFGGSIYSTYLIKKGNYLVGVIQGVTFVGLGIGLVLAWLW